MEVEMYPPAGGDAPFKKFKLNSGREVKPDFGRGGVVVVTSEAEELELFAEGWCRTANKGIDAGDLEKVFRADATRTGVVLPLRVRMRDAELRKAAHVAEVRRQARRNLDHGNRRVEFGEVYAGPRHGRLIVAHDQSANEINLHGVISSLDDVDQDLRSAIRNQSAAFLNAAQDAEEQGTIKATVGALVAAVLDRHSAMAGAVATQRAKQRYGA